MFIYIISYMEKVAITCMLQKLSAYTTYFAKAGVNFSLGAFKTSDTLHIKFLV